MSTYELLDDVIDIIVGAGWLGFIKVILLFFGILKKKILKMKYDEILIMISEM